MAKICKKIVSGLLAAGLLLGALSGCGTTPAGSSESSSGTSSASSEASTESSGSGASGEAVETGLPILEEPITITVLSDNRADISIGNDMPVIKELSARTNINIEWELLPIDATEKTTKLNVIFASGDIPDLVQIGDFNMANRYGMQGLLLPLKDLIDEHAPNMVDTFNNPLKDDEIPYDIDVWGSITAKDGEIYNVPFISASNAIGAVWAMRTDWLEAVDMEVPETTDELFEVLKAFKEKDPNGNGEQDEIPWGAGAGGKTGTITPIMTAFDAHMDLYIDKATDTVKYGPVEENYKKGLEFLNKLYAEGLIEGDYLSATRDQWLARAGGDQMGMMFVWPGSGLGTSNQELQKLNADFHFEPIKPFVSPSGSRAKDTKTAGAAVGARTSVSATTKYPVEIMKFLDYCFSDEGYLLCNFGIEGDDYNMVDGVPTYTEKILNNPDGIDPEVIRIQQGTRWQVLPYENGWVDNYQAMEKSAPWTIAAWDTYKTKGMVEAPFPVLGLTEEELSTRASIEQEINTYRDPMIDKFIMGEESLDNFDQFVAGINNSGLEDLLKLLNTAYDEYKANTKK